MLKNISKYLKKLNNDLKTLYEYLDNFMYSLNYSFNEEDYYKPKEIRSAFDSSCMLYESTGDKDAKLTLLEYFNKIRPYARDMIDNYKAKGEWKMQLVMRIIFVSFIDANETQVMHTKSDNIMIMSSVETEDIINDLFNTFCNRYKEGLETKMKGNSYILERIDLLAIIFINKFK